MARVVVVRKVRKKKNRSTAKGKASRTVRATAKRKKKK